MRQRPARRLLIAVLAVALCAASFMVVRTVRHALYWSNPAHHNVAPEGWMTLGYVERSHQLPPRSLATALELAPQRRDPLSLEQIAELRGEPLPKLLARVSTLIEAQKQ